MYIYVCVLGGKKNSIKDMVNYVDLPRCQNIKPQETQQKVFGYDIQSSRLQLACFFLRMSIFNKHLLKKTGE